MKKAIRIIVPVVLSLVVIFCAFWYLFSYDREFTRDVLVSFARFSESNGNHEVATWFYNRAYSHAGNSDAVAIELANQYRSTGNYTKAEFTLSNAIANGGGLDLYIALCNIYVEQDKLIDAVNMLNNISNPQIKESLDSIRPAAPVASPDPAFYSQYISVSLKSDGATIYATSNGEFPTISVPAYTDPIALTDGENKIQAIAIGENGLVSPVSVFGYVIGGVVEKMNFSDPAIEAEVRTVLNVSDDKELFTNDLWTIRSFTVPAEAQSCEDLKHMIYLESLTMQNGDAGQIQYLSGLTTLSELTIDNTDVTQDELSIIAALPALTKLTITNADLAGIAPLGNASGLVSLNVSNNFIRNIDAIGKLTKLQELNLRSNAVIDISSLSANTALTQLDLSVNNIASLAPLSTLTALTQLSADANSITEIGQLGNLTALTVLSLSENQLADISVLSGCSALTELNLSTNAISDISCLAKLEQLTHLDFSHNQVSELPAFSTSSALVVITGSHNQLSSLSRLSGLKNLNEVNMDYNTEISSVSPLADCPVLIRVNVYATKVTEVSVLTDQSITVNYNPVQES